MQVILHNEVNPEDNAMLQALYSRSSKSVTEHLEKLKATGSGKFMSQYYIGYGHGSIGDCGFATVYIEGISLVAAKAIEDNPLFNGQESSTRYIDFSKQTLVSPYVGRLHDFVSEWQRRFLDFYTGSYKDVVEELEKCYPYSSVKDSVPEKVYSKAISSGAFDILRGFIPCGVTTNVSVTMSLRNLKDHFEMLFHHPLSEVVEAANKVLSTLEEAYPSSFGNMHKARLYDRKSDDYNRRMDNFYLIYGQREEGSDDVRYLHDPYLYGSNEGVSENPVSQWPSLGRSNVLFPSMGPYPTFNRPRHAALPRHNLYAHQTFEFDAELDYGSFRDLQRHRDGYCSMPLATPHRGFHRWYVAMLPPPLVRPARELLEAFKEAYEDFSKSDDFGFDDVRVPLQYSVPLCAIVDLKLIYSLRELIYICELRSGVTVHPTLRGLVDNLGRLSGISSLEGVNMTDIADMPWDSMKRGYQDIVKK